MRLLLAEVKAGFDWATYPKKNYSPAQWMAVCWVGLQKVEELTVSPTSFLSTLQI